MKILIVDDEAAQRDLLAGFLKNQGYEVITAANGPEAIALFEREPINLVIMDHRMPGQTGDAVLAHMKALNPLVRAFLITAYSSVDMAVSVMKLGADEFLEKPVDLPSLLNKIRLLEQRISIEHDFAAVREALEDSPLPLRIIADSPAMQQVVSLARRIATSSFPVLIQGETGTGKELIARLVHLLGPRRDSPFVEVNCAAVPESLFESELFGHEKGSFTGAASRRRGRFELAHTGTLFLDELGEMPLMLQPKLLRALQESSIVRVGGEAGVRVDVRLVAATNRNLRDMCASGRFREDLYFRVRVLEINVPPLREHRDDIPALVDCFLERYAGRALRFSAEAMDMLIKYPFPGNVRELENVVQRTVTLARSSLICPPDLPDEIRHHQATTQGTLADRLVAVEREMLLAALEKSGWVQTRAALLLGISERVLRYKMSKHGIRAAGRGE